MIALPVDGHDFAEQLLAASTIPSDPSNCDFHIIDDVASILASHEGRNRAEVDLTRLAKVCRVCGSIAEAPDRETRDFTVANFDMTCCRNQLGEAWTVTFETTNEGRA